MHRESLPDEDRAIIPVVELGHGFVSVMRRFPYRPPVTATSIALSGRSGIPTLTRLSPPALTLPHEGVRVKRGIGALVVQCTTSR